MRAGCRRIFNLTPSAEAFQQPDIDFERDIDEGIFETGIVAMVRNLTPCLYSPDDSEVP